MLDRLAFPVLSPCERGTVTAEYTVVLVLVTVGCAGATVAIFPHLSALFRVQTLVLSLPAIF